MSGPGTALQAFLTDRLIAQRHASKQTIAAYRDTWRLLLDLLPPGPGRPRADWTSPTSLVVPVRRSATSRARRHDRTRPGQTPRPRSAHLPDRTRDQRTTRGPEPKRLGRAARPHDTLPGDPTALRISELTGLTNPDVHLGTGAHVTCHGKSRKDRITPLTSHTTGATRLGGSTHRSTPRPTLSHPHRQPPQP
jgi:integrase/recombinase XerD